MKRKNITPFVMLFIFLGVFSLSSLISNVSSSDNSNRIINGITNNLNKGNSSNTFIKVGENSKNFPTDYIVKYNQKNYGYSTLFGLSDDIVEDSYEESFNFRLATIEKSLINNTQSTNGLTFTNSDKMSLFDDNSIIINSTFAQFLIDSDSSLETINDLIGRSLSIANTNLIIAAIYNASTTSDTNFVINNLFYNAFGNIFFVSNAQFSSIVSSYDFYISIGKNYEMNLINYKYTSGFISNHGLFTFFDPYNNQMIVADDYVNTVNFGFLSFINCQQLMITIILFSVAIYLYLYSQSYSIPLTEFIKNVLLYTLLLLVFAFFSSKANITIIEADFYMIKLFEPVFIKVFLISTFCVITILLLTSIIFKGRNKTLSDEFHNLKLGISKLIFSKEKPSDASSKHKTTKVNTKNDNNKKKQLSYFLLILFVTIFNLLMTFSFYLTLKEEIVWQKLVLFGFTLLFSVQLTYIFYKEIILVNSRNRLIVSYILIPLAALLFFLSSLILPKAFSLSITMVVFLFLSVIINYIALVLNKKKYDKISKKS